MAKLTFGFVQDYLSAKGLTLERLPRGGYRIGNSLSNRWTTFATWTNVEQHLRAFH